MASVRALAVRRGAVEERLTALTERVNARLGVPLAPPVWSKVPEIAALERLEYLADLLDAATPVSAPAAPAQEIVPDGSQERQPVARPAPGPSAGAAPAAPPSPQTARGPQPRRERQ